MDVSFPITIFLLTIFTLQSSALRNLYFSHNVSSTLDHLLASNRYDKRIRPEYGGPPVEITVNLIIKSMGPVSENEQSYGLDCYFRQHWYDYRLKYYLPGIHEISLSWLFLDKVWKPDTYFVNGKKSYLHKITAPNKFIRVRYDGFLTYSMRLTLTASCPMYLRKFPLDSQRCPLSLGSYGYSSKDVVYRWEDAHAVSTVDGLELAQFDLVNISIEDEKMQERGGIEYSTLHADFWLKRHTGFFMLQVYVPCALIVLCSWVYAPCCLIVLSSWVSFWIDPDDVAARVALGVTTVLSLTTMGFGSRSQLPKVSYWTALDWFVIICFTSVFSVMIEYACVNFLDKVTKDLKKLIDSKKKAQEDAMEQKKVEEATSIVSPTLRQRSASMSAVPTPVEEEFQRKIISKEAPETTQPADAKKAGFFGIENTIKVPDFKQHVRRLSTTIQEWIRIPRLQDRFTRSVQNLSRLDRGFRDADMTIPKVIVSDEDEPQDITLDLAADDVWDEDFVEDYDENDYGAHSQTICQKLKTIYQLLLQWRLLPQESDVLKLMADPTPPDKFSKIDIQSRRSFPLAFFSSLFIYTVAFAYYLTDDFPERNTDISLFRN